MPSSYVGTRLGLLSGVPFVAGTVLSITSGNVTIPKRMASLVTVQDDLGNVVTGCTLNITDTSKCTANGMRLIGVGTSGTTAVTASKAGYTTSASITMTAGAYIFLMDVVSTAGTSTTTNGAAVTGWTDQAASATVWAEAVLSPTYLATGITGGPAVLFNGTTQLLSTSSITTYNLTNGTDNCVEGICCRTTSDGAALARVATTHLDTVVNRGVGFQVQATTDQGRFSFGTGGAVVNITEVTGTIKAAAAVSMIGTCFSVGTTTNNTFYVNGVSAGTPSNSNWRDNNVAVVHRLGINFAGAANWLGMECYWRFKVNRALTATELSQLFLACEIVCGR